jgi:hypothetical protein
MPNAAARDVSVVTMAARTMDAMFSAARILVRAINATPGQTKKFLRFLDDSGFLNRWCEFTEFLIQPRFD